MLKKHKESFICNSNELITPLYWFEKNCKKSCFN